MNRMLTALQKRWARPYAFLLLLVVASSIWSAAAGTAWAKVRNIREVEQAAPQEKEYVLPYLLVVFGVALGVMVVCRPNKRADQPKNPDLQH